MRTLGLLSLLLLAACATFNISEEHFFHPGPAQKPVPIEVPGATVETQTITTADGTVLGATHVVHPDADVEILFFGGDSFHIDDFGDELAGILVPLRTNMFMVDYRGYGRSGGTPTIAALKSDVLLAFDHLRARTGTRPIVVHGFSLGSFMAAHVAANRPAAGLVLESSAPDVTTWANAQVPMYAKASVRIKIAPALLKESNTAALKNYTGPLLVMTGSLDKITPPRFSETLLAASPSPNKRMAIVPGANHGDVLAFPPALTAYRELLDAVRQR